MNKIAVGFIGLGMRGTELLKEVLRNFKDRVEVVAVCDTYQDRAIAAAETVKENGGNNVKAYVDYTELLKDEKVKAVIISAAWEAHVSLAVTAMKARKITALEVGGAYSIDDCWALVRTYEETKTPFMFMENCCYGMRELTVTKLVRMGKFGEIVYCHGSYCHDLREEIASGVKNRHYRLRNYLTRNCDNYPTHNLGPIAKILNINRGNRMLTVSSMASKARGLCEFVKSKEEYAFLQDKTFSQGDVVCSQILCADGALITLKLDTTLPRAYSREFSVSGTKGLCTESDNVILTDDMHIDHNKEMGEYRDSAKHFQEEYLPKSWQETVAGLQSGHGGMDGVMLKSFFDAIETGAEMPIDVYDAASWMCITCLSEASIAKGGAPMEIPDFTCGKWIMRESKDVMSLTEPALF